MRPPTVWERPGGDGGAFAKGGAFGARVPPDHPAAEHLDALFVWALAKSSSQRPQSARELVEEFLSALGGVGRPHVEIRPETDAPRLPKLPRYRNALVGRGPELEQLAERLEGSSMVTLIGPGGIGKTRLAVELGAKLKDNHEDAAVFVDLSPLADPSLVPRTIASSLGLRDDGIREPIDVVTTYLEPKSLLLLLDNCEQVLGAAATAAEELLSQCPDLAILATSREALGVSGEIIWEVPSLASRNDRSAAAGSPTTGDAVELFRVRAEASAPKSFTWNDSVLLDVTQICDKLDGIPLAIELAAARVRVISPKDLLAGLNQRFALLTAGSSTATPRQRSLEATLDWSYQLLNPVEQTVLERLAVFAGGFSPDAAEAVCADEQLAATAVVPALFSLVEKSLIRHVTRADGSTRYNLLETIREYGRNKLRSRADRADVYRRHALYFAAMAAPNETELRTARQVQWLTQLETELDNFRTAMEWGLQREPLLAMEVATSLGDFWTRRHPGEGSAWVTRAISAKAPTGRLQALANEVAGTLAWAAGNVDIACALHDEAARQWAAFGDQLHVARVTGFLGRNEFYWRGHELGLERMKRAVALLRPLDDPWNLAFALNNLGYCHHEIRDSLTAKAVLGEALQHARRADDPWLMGIVLDSVTEVDDALGQVDESLAHLRECAAVAMSLGDAWLHGNVLRSGARLALLEQDPESCVRLMAASKAAYDSIGVAEPLFAETVEATISRARGQLSQAVAGSAWREGQAMTAEDAIASVAGIAAGTLAEGKS